MGYAHIATNHVRRCFEYRRVVPLLEQIRLRSVRRVGRGPVGTGISQCRPLLTHKMHAVEGCQGIPRLWCESVNAGSGIF